MCAILIGAEESFLRNFQKLTPLAWQALSARIRSICN